MNESNTRKIIDFDIDLNEVAILFGAGISLDAPSSTPLGFHLTQCLLNNALHPVCLEYRDAFLISSNMKSEMGLYLRFEKICEVLEKHGGNLEFLRFFEEYRRPNANHKALAYLANAGATLLTTNFDCLVEISSAIQGHELKVVNLTESDCSQVSKNTLYKLHGSAGARLQTSPGAALATTIKSVSDPQLTNRLNKFLQIVLQQKHLIVMGYSGYDDFDVSPALVSINSCKRLIWLNHDRSSIGRPVAQTIGCLDQKSKPKSILLCEKMIARGARVPGMVQFLNCHTGRVLESIVFEDFREQKPTDNSIDTVRVEYEEHVKIWAENNLDDLKRRAISVDLLIALDRFTLAYSLLSDRALFFSSNTPVQKYLLVKFFHCLAKLPGEITEEDTEFAMRTCAAISKFKLPDVDFLTNLGIFFCSIKREGLADQCFQHARSLMQTEADSERKIRVELNYAVRGQPELLTNRQWLEAMLVRAERCAALNLVPSIIFFLAEEFHDSYYLRLADAAALVGDSLHFIRAIVKAFSATDKYRTLVMAVYSDADYFEFIRANDPHTYSVLCLLVARYLSDANLPGAGKLVSMGWEIACRQPEFTSDLKAYYSAEAIDICIELGDIDQAISVLKNCLPFMGSITEPFARFGLLSRKYKLDPSIEASVEAMTYAVSTIESAKENGFSLELSAALSYLNDTNNALVCFEAAIGLLKLDLNADQFWQITNNAGDALFNLRRLDEAKEFWLSAHNRFPELSVNNSALLFNLARVEFAKNHLESAARLMICSDELGDRTMMTARRDFRQKIERHIPTQQLAEWAQEMAVVFRHSGDLNASVRRLLVELRLLDAVPIEEPH